MANIKNEMLTVSEEVLYDKINHIDEETTVIVKIDGKEILDKFMFIDVMQDKFRLPDDHCYRDDSREPMQVNWSAFYDRMAELSWFPDEMNFILVIYHFQEFLKDNLEDKRIILDIFKSILYFWEEEVVHVVVEGQARGFNIYLVD